MLNSNDFTSAAVESRKILSLKGRDLYAIASEILTQGNLLTFTVDGFSMFPIIKPGDTVTIISIDVTRLKTGDIILFFHPDEKKLMVHRLLLKRKNTCIASGDNNSESDGQIPLNCILGRVKYIGRGEKENRFGIGPEKYVLAYLSRLKLLRPLIQSMNHFFLLVKRFK